MGEENPFKYMEEDSKPMLLIFILVVVAIIGLWVLLCPAGSSVDDTLARIEAEASQVRAEDPMAAAMAMYKQREDSREHAQATRNVKPVTGHGHSCGANRTLELLKSMKDTLPT